LDKTAKLRKRIVTSRLTLAPENFDEAVVQQVPQIQEKMNSLCRLLAKCGITTNSPTILALFARLLQQAIATQIVLGPKAEWRKITYTAPVTTRSMVGADSSTIHG
jgi:hypothetical protein